MSIYPVCTKDDVITLYFQHSEIRSEVVALNSVLTTHTHSVTEHQLAICYKRFQVGFCQWLDLAGMFANKIDELVIWPGNSFLSKMDVFNKVTRILIRNGLHVYHITKIKASNTW